MKSFVGFALIFFTAVGVSAQNNRLIEIDSPAYVYITNLQHHGHLLGLNPTDLPYTQREAGRVLQSVDLERLNQKEKQWLKLLRALVRLDEAAGNKQDFRYGLELSAGSYLGNSRRKSALRPLDNNIFAYPSASLGGYIEDEHFVGQATVRHNLYYDRDPDGLDAARRLYIRSEDAYLGYNGDWLKVYLGRFKNHWAPWGETSSILSANPNSYDQLNIRFGSDRLSLRGVFARLDNISANGTYNGFAYREGAKQRFLVSHRFDWRPTDRFGIAFFESVIYSGQNSGFSFKYFNPLHTYAFVTDNRPKNDENNLLLGGMIWGQWRGWTFNSQLMLDDFQVETNIEKHTFTVTSSLYKAGLIRNLDLGLEFEAVSYQTYNPTQPEGRYLYLKRGLATQFNDYILGSLYANVYTPRWLSGLTLTPKLQVLFQGEQTINQPLVKTYPDGRPIDYILTGNAEQTLRPSLAFRYQKGRHFRMEGDVGANFIQDVDHQPGEDASRFAGFIKFGFDFTLLKR